MSARKPIAMPQYNVAPSISCSVHPSKCLNRQGLNSFSHSHHFRLLSDTREWRQLMPLTLTVGLCPWHFSNNRWKTIQRYKYVLMWPKIDVICCATVDPTLIARHVPLTFVRHWNASCESLPNENHHFHLLSFQWTRSPDMGNCTFEVPEAVPEFNELWFGPRRRVSANGWSIRFRSTMIQKGMKELSFPPHVSQRESPDSWPLCSANRRNENNITKRVQMWTRESAETLCHFVHLRLSSFVNNDLPLNVCSFGNYQSNLWDDTATFRIDRRPVIMVSCQGQFTKNDLILLNALQHSNATGASLIVLSSGASETVVHIRQMLLEFQMVWILCKSIANVLPRYAQGGESIDVVRLSSENWSIHSQLLQVCRCNSVKIRWKILTDLRVLIFLLDLLNFRASELLSQVCHSFTSIDAASRTVGPINLHWSWKCQNLRISSIGGMVRLMVRIWSFWEFWEFLLTCNCVNIPPPFWI